METIQNRETWLRSLAALMAPRFTELGRPIPPFRVGIGFTGGGRGSRANGEAWDSKASADGHFEIFITPDTSDPVQAAAILCHELIHTAVGFKHGHKGDFAAMMKTLGMDRPYTTSTPGDSFKEWVAPFLAELGEMPHGSLMYRQAEEVRKARKGRGAGDESGDDCDDSEDEERGSSNEKKTQSTRMLKACCDECGYTVRISKKWLDDKGVICPDHGKIEM